MESKEISPPGKMIPGVARGKTRMSGMAFWVVNAAGWAAFAAFQLVTYSRDVRDIPGFMTWYVFRAVIGFAITSLLRLVYGHVGFRTGRAGLRILNVVAASAVAANVWYFGEYVIIRIMSHGTAAVYTLSGHYIGGVYFQRIFLDFWIVSSWSVLYLGIKFWMAWIEQKARAEKMELLAGKAQLEMLRYQINPHFLFNALSSISVMAGEERNDLKDTINNLSAILRYSLDEDRKGMVPFSEEMEIVRRYLEIEKMRFEDFIEVKIGMDPAAADFPVPCFLIQPLVENAVKHGMKAESMPLRIEIGTLVENDRLVITVFDSGPWVGRPGAARPEGDGTGTGLSNVRRRLETAYPGDHRLDIHYDENGVLVRLVIGRRKAGM